MRPLVIDVSELLRDPLASLTFNTTYDIDRFDVGTEPFLLPEGISVAVEIVDAGAGLLVHGNASAQAIATCSRCLCEFPISLSAPVDTLYLSDSAAEDDGESERVAPDETIDLAPVVVAALVLEAPFVPLHDDECSGLCPTCGVDLNTESCGCSHAPDDAHPFAALRDLVVEPEHNDAPE